MTKTNKTGITRRNLLKGTLALGGGMAVFGGAGPLSRLASASEGKDTYYVFAYFSGGWDILLGLDPRDPAVFTEENSRTTRIQPAYDLLESGDGQLVRAGGITFGPHIGDLAAHASKLAVVRGMSMETLTHEAGRRRFITGKPPSGLQARGSSAATWFAARFGQEEPIPNLSIRVESYNVDQPNYATALSANGVPDLIRALRPADPQLDALQANQLDHLLSTVASCRGAQRSPTWQAAETGRQKARQMTVGALDRLFDFSAPSMAAIRDHYAIGAGNAGLQSPEAQAAMAAQAIKGGVSRVVSMQVANGLDTHFDEWASDQGPNQQRGFDAVARLIEDLESSQYKDTSESWLDHTVIVGFSEFSRTAMLNERGGRDHSLTNASFVAGAGIKGGTVVGQSSDVGLEPLAIDLTTGRPDPGGDVPRPEHIIQTLMHNAGITSDEADLRVGPIDAMRV
ncbi:MAG: DUF1501 domain-containing protein [Deltaproteobacteria bacterium]